MQLAIRADAWYRNGDASVTSGDATGSLYETDAEYIFTAEKAEKLAKLCSRFFCGRTFKISARLNQPVSPGGNYRIDTGSSGTQFTALAISCTYDPDKAIYSATFLTYGDILVDTTRFKETASGNPLDSVISEISNKLEGVISGQPEMGPPSPPKTLNAVAEEKGIQLSCVPEIVGVRNSLTAFKWEINKGNGWEQRESAEPSYFWQFDRSTDGYPEATDFAAWRVRCYVISIYGKNSEYTPEQNINTDQYGTWKLLPPKVTVSVSNRAINLKMEQPQRSDNRPVYGTLSHRIEVKNPKIDTEFYKPAESLDPYAAELNYKEGSGYVTAVLSYTQIMPLEGQNDDPPGPTYTLYQFRITAANEATTSEPTIQNATANPTSVYDMVKGWEFNEQGEKVKIPGALGAENIYTESLAAISANMGDIKAGSVSSVPEAGETKPNVLLDLDNEEFRIGNTPSLEDSGSEDAEYIHYTKGQGLVMKIKNFVVTALASIISGIFRVKAKGSADSDSFFVVNPETTTDTPTSTKGKTVSIKGDINAVSASFAGKKKFEYFVPDLGGQERYICIADITVFWNNETGTNLPHYGFTGTITSTRTGGYMSEDIENISCRCGYSNPKKNDGLSIALFYGGGNNAGTNRRFIPCIIEHLRDGKIYLAFKYHGSGKKLSLDGYFFNCLSDFLVLYNTDNFVVDELLMGSQWSFKDLAVNGELVVAGKINHIDITAVGNGNMGVGPNAMPFPSTGEDNTAVGYNALALNKEGSGNTALGQMALFTNSSGNYNTAVGINALTKNTTGAYNTAVGEESLKKNTTGRFNTAIGNQSLINNTTGESNVGIGFFSDCFYPEWDNQINLNGRLYYLEFSASATQAKVYNTLRVYVPAGSFISALGEIRRVTVSRLDGKTNSIELIASDNTKLYTYTNGSTATLGHSLRLWFMNIINPVSDNNK